VYLSLNRSDETDLPWLSEEVVESTRRAVESLEPPGVTLNVIVVDDPYIREINREFRNIDKPTDVISFSYLGDGDSAEQCGDDIAGEIYISYQIVEEEAKRVGVDPGLMFLRVGVHGLLHVTGFDHETDEDAALMEREEKSILSRLVAPAELEELF
jgi:probable rRNA maturation factor